jgi:hypothetical protein
MKAANSIVRQGVTGGHFKGKSKQLYDCLYSLPRGAVVPSRKIRIRRTNLMTKAHIGSRVTFDANILHLRNIGLIRVRNIAGEHEGNEYEVLLPEEVSMPSQSSLSSLTTQASPAQNQDRLDSPESSQTRHSSSQIESTTSEESKTLSLRPPEKTFDDDDAALAGLVASFRTASKEITGRDLSHAENDRWRELADVLVAELKIAAGRTTVSSVPAFLAEHLRRRLWKIDKKQARAEGRELPDETVSSPSQDDISGCPDCSGSGWWYPEGVDKGVAKCRHERLAQEGKDS